jgi:hypothetical protein
MNKSSTNILSRKGRRCSPCQAISTARSDQKLRAETGFCASRPKTRIDRAVTLCSAHEFFHLERYLPRRTSPYEYIPLLWSGFIVDMQTVANAKESGSQVDRGQTEIDQHGR